VALKIGDSGFEYGSLILKEPETAIARVTEQPANFTRLMAMVDTKVPTVTLVLFADRTFDLLGGQHLVVFNERYPIVPL